MTEKRFELIPHCNNENIWYGLFDNQELEYVANVWASGKKICNLLNEQHEKIEFVSLLANHRKEMIAFANSLIQDLDDETEKEMWETFKEEMWQKWKKQRGIK